jgi:signal transduction histidine kinase
VALAALLRSRAEETADAPAKPDISLCWTIPPELPRLYTDPVKVKVVIKNLIANALKFTEHGTVEIAARAGDGGVQISVRDTGIGINAETLPVIFEAFRQADSSSTRRYAGVGLGLYIVRRLLDMLGGTISVETAEARGSTFSIWLPTDSPADERKA